MAPRKTDRAHPTRDEFESMSRDIAQDAVAAARIGWRMASRIGRFSLHVAERATRELMDRLE